jgi:hypothetical protein
MSGIRVLCTMFKLKISDTSAGGIVLRNECLMLDIPGTEPFILLLEVS